jgi:uncharacterized membrane protein YcaP (DUF421 family)
VLAVLSARSQIATVLIVRMGKRRFISRATTFDMILDIMLGSPVSRAIVGSASFAPMLAAAAVLLAAHRLFSARDAGADPLGAGARPGG